jgi:hypothetical protein
MIRHEVELGCKAAELDIASSPFPLRTIAESHQPDESLRTEPTSVTTASLG